MPADSDGPRTLRIRPFGVRVAVVALGALLFGATAAVWFAFPQEVRDQFTTFQRLTVLFFGLAYAAAGYGMARSRVDAGESGLRVVNGYRTHSYRWGDVSGVRLRSGSPWAILDLADGSTSSAMGIHGSDGSRAAAQVRLLRAEISRHR
jgi:hypothetical protein